ncbi:MAG: hypothetical protein E6H02_07530, partial [Bacillati bacterium ANGP1]
MVVLVRSVEASADRRVKVGVVFPQTEIGTDPAHIAEFARAAEEIGYDHLVAYDHVLGAVPR